VKSPSVIAVVGEVGGHGEYGLKPTMYAIEKTSLQIYAKSKARLERRNMAVVFIRCEDFGIKIHA